MVGKCGKCANWKSIDAILYEHKNVGNCNVKNRKMREAGELPELDSIDKLGGVIVDSGITLGIDNECDIDSFEPRVITDTPTGQTSFFNQKQIHNMKQNTL